MSSNRPRMLINLPPPPSDPATPNEHGPGTPNSTTTSLSALSVVAIKDGAMGHGGRGAGQSANALEAERADRISRLAGLERVATVRAAGQGNLMPGGQGMDPNAPQFKERSTVGSASATGSVGGRTTWADQSMDEDPDRMSEDRDDTSSAGGFSDEDKASLVGFGEGANSTVSGPVSTANARMMAASARQNAMSATTPRTGFAPSTGSGGSTPMSGIMPTGLSNNDPRMMDGITYDRDILDTTTQPPVPYTARPSNRFSGSGTEMAEGIVRDRLGDTEAGRPLGTSDNQQQLGSFSFERNE